MARGWTGWHGWQGQMAPMAPSMLLRRHWQGLRDGPALPRRDRIAPRSIAPMLDHAIMVERRYDGAVLLRYAGMAVNAVHGQDLTGRPLSALFETGMRERLLAALEMAFSGQRTLELELLSERGMARPLLSARMTLLPLAPVGVEGITLIGCIDLDGPPILPPRRFRIDRVLGEPLGATCPEGGAAPRKTGADAPRQSGPVLVWSGT